MQLTPDLFLDCIILLLHENGQRHQKLINDLIKLYEAETKEKATPDDLTQFYIKIIAALMSDTLDRSDPDALSLILLRFKSDRTIAGRHDIFDLLRAQFDRRSTLSADALADIATRLQTTLVWHRTSKTMRTMFGSLNRVAEMIDAKAQKEKLAEIARYANELTATVTTATDENGTAVDVINFTDIDSLRRGMSRVRERNIDGVIRTGLQGLNRMLGNNGGFVEGESVTFNALPHQYKSGLLNSCAMWIPLYNPPPPVDKDGLKPMVYMASVENETFQNMYWIFKQQYILRTGRSPAGLTDEEVAQWLYDLFAAAGYTLVIERHQPQDFGFEEYVQRMTYYRSIGYRVRCSIIDYANEMRMGSLDKNASSAGKSYQVRELFSRLCNWNKAVGTTFITAHPLNREADAVAHTYKLPVKEFSLKHLADSTDVERQVDVSIYVHLTYNEDLQRFLTMYIRKHRYVDDTPETHKFTAYPFTPLGILDDINGAPGYVKDIFSFNAETAMDESGDQAMALAASLF